MNREETIKWLKSLKSEVGKAEHRSLWHYAKAIDMVIEALSTKGDLISRQWLLDLYETPKDGDGIDWKVPLEVVRQNIKDAPSALTSQNLTEPNNACEVDLISRADAIERFCEFGTSLERQGKTMITMVDAKYAFIETLESLPSAEAVSRKDTVTLNSPISIQADMVAVVRCKDCRHQEFYLNDNESFHCDKAHIANMHMDDGDGDFFCKYGERREP